MSVHFRRTRDSSVLTVSVFPTLSRRPHPTVEVRCAAKVKESQRAVHDDAELKLGDVRSKHQGSDGGLKGLRSLFSALGNEGFMTRVRIGVQYGRQ